MTTKSPKQSRSSLPPNLLAAARIQRLLEPFTIETKRTILHFIHQSIEEAFQADARVQLTQLGMQATNNADWRNQQQQRMDFARSGLEETNGAYANGRSD